VHEGGHPVPPQKIRSRYRKLTENVLAAVELVDRLAVVDNTEKGRALRDVLLFEHGNLIWRASDLPKWASNLFSQYLK
jgi:predicted ABC-type ATPase